MATGLFTVDKPLDLLIFMVLGHFVADYALQGDKMAVEKCPGKDVTLDWRWWLTAHAGTHGFVVACLTGIPLLGIAEMIAHSLIDFGKCRLGYKMIVDQMLHWTCKLVWVVCVMGIR